MTLRDWNSDRHIAAACQLLTSRPMKPYRFFAPLVGHERVESLALERVRRTLAGSSTIVKAAWDSDELIALGAVVPLPWDSGILGFGVGRLDFAVAAGSPEVADLRLRTVLEALCAASKARELRSLSIRVGGDELVLINALERNGFQLLDGIQTFSLQLTAPQLPAASRFKFRLAEPGDENSLANIARTAYRFDRFHADPMVSPAAADRLHEEWIRNSCRGLAADAVLVALDDDRIVGYVTCKIDHETASSLGVLFGVIVLVATAEQYRGAGVAVETTNRALDWFWAQGVRVVDVGTQIRNIPAGRTYEKAGFRLTDVSLTFRRDLSL